MSIINSQPRIGAAGQSTGFKIERSLRFNSADSAYLNRTPASASNRKTWTWSAWVKRSTLGAIQELFDGYWANTDNGYFWVGFTSADAFEVQLYNSTLRTTTQVFRDPSAWYHFVLAVDTTQATAANRVKVYLNGSEITTFSTNNAPTQNLDTAVNYNGAHYIGTFSGTTNLFNGYLTEINLIDGQALTPSSFGETDTDTGVWKPKAYSGSYGTNGFYLKFADNSGTTSTTLGKDSSGNGNNWTPNNFSVTAGAGNDSLVDTPTPYGTDTGAGGEVRGNYCTLNPLAKNSGATLSNGNLDWSATGSNQKTLSTIGMSSGKWYCEITVTTATYLLVGIAPSTSSLTTYVGENSDSYGFGYLGQKWNNGSGSSYSTAPVANDVVGIAFDADAGTLTFYKNGTSLGTAFSSIPANTYHFAVGTDSTAGSVNFGQRPFAYTAPSGFKALCTQNLPTPTIGATATTRADDYFNTVLYTGNSSGASVTGVGFQPDFVWMKSRGAARNHELLDAVRGGSSTLFSNLTNAEATDQRISAFGSDGFTYTTNSNSANSSEAFVAWNWKANGAGSTNNAGSIQSTVSASTASGFSVVTYTGTGVNATVGHGLGVAPVMIIVKCRNASGDIWDIYNKEIGPTKFLRFASNAAGTFNSWQDTNPTSSVFYISTDTVVNTNGNTYVAYCFAPIAGYSAFGSYTGNGSTDGPFMYTGFRPAWVLVKASSTTGDWLLYDNKRNAYNVVNNILYPNLSDAEATSGGGATLDFVSNGFKLRGAGAGFNDSGTTFVYACFAENPFKYSLAR